MSMTVRDQRLEWRDYDTQANTQLVKMRQVSVAVDPASIGTLASAETAVTINGLAVGDLVLACPPASLETGLVFSGVRVSAANTLQLRLSNMTAGSVDGASRTWQFLCFDLTPP